MAKRSQGYWLHVAVLGWLGALAVGLFSWADAAEAPTITRFVVGGNDLSEIDGRGRPGATFTVRWRQRLFKGAGVVDFYWCDFTTADWINLGTVTVPASGQWKLKVTGLDVQAVPGGIGRASYDSECFANASNEFELRGPGFATATPSLEWFHLLGGSGPVDTPTGPSLNVALMAQVSGAHSLAAAIADGPDDSPDAPWLGWFDDLTVEKNDDVDEVGVDVCALSACGARVKFANDLCVNRDGLGPECPVIQEFKGGREFPFLLALLQAHRPGGSLLVVSKLRREVPGASVLKVSINAEDEVCVCGACISQKHFEFF